MTNEDFEQIKFNLSNDFDDFWTVTSLESQLNNDNNYFEIAKKENQIVGFAGLMNNVDCTEILNVVVHKDYRHQGIATKLLEGLIDYSKSQNKKTIMLEVNEQNDYAINLYKKFNFREVGRRKSYYDNKYDAILMNLDLV